jgi:hypothetical protein
MEVAIADAVFLTHWFVSRSVAEVGRRQTEPMTAVLTAAARLRADGWDLPYRPLEDTAYKPGRKPVLAPLRDDPDGGAWGDADGATWTPAGKAGRTAVCCRCGRTAGPNGLTRRADDEHPTPQSACPGCVTVVQLPGDEE